ncbi:MAG: hypothetical protein RBU21_15220 [FCB group bacterium]|jgi:L-arabinose isomerase|nr:hypothetical protein [FCB group bacterium]
MVAKPRAGLMPLYLKLYDEVLPDLLPVLDVFLREVADALREQGIDVTVAPVSRTQAECKAATALFAKDDVDVIVTLHLAYSPSLEAIDALCDAPQPVLMLDTTTDAAFGLDVDPIRLLYNHGIHGVQDLANLLLRRGKPYWVVAGHLSDPAVAVRAAAHVRALRAARRLRGVRALRIGPQFEGMGDFQVRPDVLAAALDLDVKEISSAELAPYAAAVTQEAVDAELEADRLIHDVDAPVEAHRRSLRVGLGLRRLLEEGEFRAFSMNFAAFQSGEGPVDTVPFLECSKAMSRGIGYAGEGDVLTATLVQALHTMTPMTSFTEIFCPDWKGGSLFLSHMGEFNPDLAAGKARLYEKEYGFSPAKNPVCVACAPKAGPATFVNLAPGPDDTFRLIIVPVEILEDGTHPDMRDWVRAWMRPRIALPSFLETYSRLGGTHHSALMLGEHTEALEVFAKAAGLEAHVIGGEVH